MRPITRGTEQEHGCEKRRRTKTASGQQGEARDDEREEREQSKRSGCGGGLEHPVMRGVIGNVESDESRHVGRPIARPGHAEVVRPVPQYRAVTKRLEGSLVN